MDIYASVTKSSTMFVLVFWAAIFANVLFALGVNSHEISGISSVEKSTTNPLCRGAFDLYFVLDRSGSVSKSNFRVQTVNFVQNISAFFISPKLRISLISFSTTATIDLELTGDRKRITAGIERLKTKIPNGNTNLHLGLQEAIDQAKRLGGMSASVIIVLTDGRLTQHQKAIDAANNARSQGATVYSVGVDNYQIADLKAIANSPAKDHVFTADDYASLKNLVASIVKKTCIEILSAEPSHVCTGKKFEVSLTGSGFTKTNNISQVFCRFQINATHSHVTRPLKVTAKHLSCPAPAIQLSGSSVILQVSVNGKTFVSSNVTVTSKDCTARSQGQQSKINGKAILIFFLVVLLISFILAWWFWKLFPCAKPERDVPIVADNSTEPKKWPTVDASFYGGGGVGGMKPVRVNWGDKGATEAGNKLTKPLDANVIEVSNFEPEESKRPSCSSQLKLKCAALGAAISSLYSRVASYRPTKGGTSKLFTSKTNNN